MARIIKSSGSGPLYTGDSFSTVIDRNVKRTPGKSGIDKLGEALSIADKLAKSEVVGAVGGLISKGASKIGQAIEEAGMLSGAEEERETFEKEKEALRKQIEKEMETPTEEADVVENELNQKIDRNNFIGTLKTKLEGLNRDTRVETIKLLNEGFRRKLITPQEREKILAGIERKAATPVSEEVINRLNTEIKDFENKANIARTELQSLEEKGIAGGSEYENIFRRYEYYKNERDKKVLERNSAASKVSVETPPEMLPEQEIIKRIKDSGKVEQTLLALRARKKAGQLSIQQEMILNELEKDLEEKPTVNKPTVDEEILDLENKNKKMQQQINEVLSRNPYDTSTDRLLYEIGKNKQEIERLRREQKVSPEEIRKAKQISERPLTTSLKTQEQLKAEMEAASEDGEMIGSDETIPMEPTGPMNIIDEQEKERQRKLQSDPFLSSTFKSSKGLSYDIDGNPIISPAKEALTEEDLLSAARQAVSPEEQSAVLAAIEDADITPKTLLDMATGAHKQRFADRVKGMFPKVKTLTPEERALYRARIAKLGEETKVIVPRAVADIESKGAGTVKTREQTKFIAPKAEADIESKKAGAALSRTRTNEVQQKVDALWKGINLPVSQIIKNLRKPTGSGAGAAAAKRLALSAAARLADNERRRLAQEYDKDIEVDKQNISKVDSEINKLGPDEAMPSKPKIGSPDNVAKYEKEVARVKQANAKREQLRREKEVSVNAMNSKQTEKVAKIKDIDEAESEVIKRVIDLPDTKKKETKPAKPVTPASTPATKPRPKF